MHRVFTSHGRSVRRTGPASSFLVMGALSALLLAGCSSGGTTGNSATGAVSGGTSAQGSSGAIAAPGSRDSAPGIPPAPGASAGSAVSKSGTLLPAGGSKLTKSASLDLQVKNIDAAAARVRAIATGLQAQVLSEQIGTGGSGGPVPLQGRGGPVSPQTQPDTQSQPDAEGDFGTLTLSVPADKLDTALDQLARIGTVLQRNVSSQDVTAQYVDTQSRLKTMRASVERVRTLMAQAKDLGQVVALESELSRRQADLESLESQLGALKNSVEQSTLTISLSTPGNAPVTSAGFVGGLRSGWDAFAASARGLLTAIGAALPFAIVLALVATPVAWWMRRRRTSPVGQLNN